MAICAGSGAGRTSVQTNPLVFGYPQDVLWEHVYKSTQAMTETLSIRIDSDTKKRLDALSKRSKRSKSFLAAEAIAAYVATEEWQLGELQTGIAELESGKGVSHEKVSKWLKSWGKPGETKALR
jgi:RHH-type transcriptional regulator, rel operon repressor / antitoxin RelB